ncbi:Peroxisome biosynthesis protein pex1 [Phlyctochytrium bullatum]|nr:Peroxisome biosynthesis protein pex1 [Phlyctochytrium bullatum]
MRNVDPKSATVVLRPVVYSRKEVSSQAAESVKFLAEQVKESFQVGSSVTVNPGIFLKLRKLAEKQNQTTPSYSRLYIEAVIDNQEPPNGQAAVPMCVEITNSSMKSLQILVKETVYIDKDREREESSHAPTPVGGLQPLIDRVMHCIRGHLASCRDIPKGNIGKEKGIKNTLFLDCVELRRYKAVALKARFKEILSEAIWHGPTAIFLDNLDQLLPSSDGNDAAGGSAESKQSIQIAEYIIKEIVEGLKLNPNIVIIASIEDRAKLSPYFLSRLCISEFFTIKAPDKTQRLQILEAILNSTRFTPRGVDFLKIATSTEGFTPRDLHALIECAINSASLELCSQPKGEESDTEIATHVLTQKHFDAALKDYIPPSRRGVRNSTSSVSWADIGVQKREMRYVPDQQIGVHYTINVSYSENPTDSKGGSE